MAMLQYKLTRIAELGYVILECYKDNNSIFFNYDYSPFDMKKIKSYLDDSPLMKSLLDLNKIINKNKNFLRNENQISEEQQKSCIGSLKAIPVIRKNLRSLSIFRIDFATDYWLNKDFEQHMENPIVKGVADAMYVNHLPWIQNPELNMKMPSNLGLDKRVSNQ